MAPYDVRSSDGEAVRHGGSALSLAVRHNHTYLALKLLETGASLTPEAGELLGLHNVLTVPQVLHTLVRAHTASCTLHATLHHQTLPMHPQCTRKDQTHPKYDTP